MAKVGRNQTLSLWERPEGEAMLPRRPGAPLRRHTTTLARLASTVLQHSPGSVGTVSASSMTR